MASGESLLSYSCVAHNKVLGKMFDTYRLPAYLTEHAGSGEVAIVKHGAHGTKMMTGRDDTGGLTKSDYVVFLEKESCACSRS